MELTVRLIDILEEMYSLEKKLDKIVAWLTKSKFNDAPNFLDTPNTKLEQAVIKSLGGTDEQWFYFLEPGTELDPFFEFRKGNIDRDEFIRQIKKGIALNLKLE